MSEKEHKGDFSRLQWMVANFVDEHQLEAPVPARALDLSSEVGELAKEVLKGTNYGRAPFQTPDGWRAEIGDALFSLACLANSTGVDLETALDAALQKYRRRLREGDAGSGC